jgi:tetratricopeptide (TPR) repeat protein
MTEPKELLDRYEATGDEEVYAQADRLYLVALAAEGDNARLLLEYGYLQECRGRFALRTAAARYEHAIVLAPDWDKPRHQLIGVQAALQRTDQAIALYQRRLAEAPDEPREYRFLAQAYLVAQEPGRAEQVVHAGLRLAPDDSVLLEQLGEVCAATDRPEEALGYWRRVFELDPDRIDPHYSAAFLLERQGRVAEAIGQWRLIIDWLVARGFTAQTAWPKRELERLQAGFQGQ